MLESWVRASQEFTAEAHKILSKHETSKSRVVILEHTYSQLSSLSVKQDDLFRQALRCLENKLFRASHVMAWAAFMDFVEVKLGEDGYKRVNVARKNWTIACPEDLREYPDHQVLECLTLVGLISKTEEKALKGKLSTRNECAHPSDYYPELNTSLGYVSDLINRVAAIQKRQI